MTATITHNKETITVEKEGISELEILQYCKTILESYYKDHINSIEINENNYKIELELKIMV